MTKSMWVNVSCPCVQTFSCLIAWYTPTWNLKIHQLYEFVAHISSQSGNGRWQMISKLAQFTDAFSFSLQIRVIESFFQVICSVFLKGTYLGIFINGIFCTWARLFLFLASYLPTVTLLIYFQDLTKCWIHYKW